jgi:hypothetical protein
VNGGGDGNFEDATAEPESGSSDWSTTEVQAVAVGPCIDGLVAIRLADGSNNQLPVPEELTPFLRPEMRVLLYHGPRGELLGWCLPDRQVGVDLRT